MKIAVVFQFQRLKSPRNIWQISVTLDDTESVRYQNGSFSGSRGFVESYYGSCQSLLLDIFDIVIVPVKRLQSQYHVP